MVARYDEPDELVMNEEGKVVVLAGKTSKASSKSDASSSAMVGVDANDNAERVRQEEVAKKQRSKEEAQKKKDLLKKDDSKAKKAEALEKRREKAKKGERRGKVSNNVHCSFHVSLFFCNLKRDFDETSHRKCFNASQLHSDKCPSDELQ